MARCLEHPPRVAKHKRNSATPQPAGDAKLRLRELIAKIALPPLQGATLQDPDAWSDKLTKLKGLGVPMPPPDPVGHSLPSETLRQ